MGQNDLYSFSIISNTAKLYPITSFLSHQRGLENNKKIYSAFFYYWSLYNSLSVDHLHFQLGLIDTTRKWSFVFSEVMTPIKSLLVRKFAVPQYRHEQTFGRFAYFSQDYGLLSVVQHFNSSNAFFFVFSPGCYKMRYSGRVKTGLSHYVILEGGVGH